MSDVFYKADLRFTVTGGSSNFFNGNFDSAGNLPTNTTNVININVAGQSGVPSNGITYPQGAVYISFYYTNHAYTAISLRHKSNGVYYSSTGTDVSTSGAYKVIKFPISGNNYLTDIEISITTDANLVKVAGINYLADRWTTQLELPYVSKYLTSNTVFGDFGISGESSSSGPHLKLEGTYTTWELENQYTGGANNDMFRIRNTALGSDALVINRADNRVGIGTTNPTAQLHVSGNALIDPTANGVTLTVGRYSGQPSIKAGTDDGGYLIMDSSSNYLSLNHYVNKDVILAFGGGEVGIGTNDPKADLHVNGNVHIGSNTNPNSFGALQVNQASNVDEAGIGVLSASAGRSIRIWVDETRSYINSGNGGGGILVLNEGAGNVGIGTTSPSAKLDVSITSGNAWMNLLNGSETNFRLTTYNNGTSNGSNAYAFKHGLYYSTTENAAVTFYRGGGATGGFLTFTTNDGSERMRIDSSGDVGIGTTNPSYKLDVNGSSNSTSLHVNGIDQHSSIRYTLPSQSVSFARTAASNGSDQWFKIYSGGGSTTLIRLNVIGGGDNTQSNDEFLISVAGYGFKHHIQRLPAGRYNGSKLLAIATTNPSAGGTVEIWIKLDGMVSGTASTHVFANAGLQSANILSSATGTAPTITSNGTQLDISATNRNETTIMASRGATFGDKVGIGTTSPSSLLHLEAAASPALQIKDTTNNVTFKAYAQDSNSHLANTSNHDLFIDTNNTPRITVKADGKVGINTGGSTLYNSFTVQGNANISNGDGAFLTFNNGDANITVHYDGTTGRDLSFKTWNSTQGNIERMRLDKNGNLGIGTNSPARNLHIHEGDSTLSYIQITNDTTGTSGSDGVSFGITSDEVAIWNNRENTDSTISTNNTEAIRIKNDGNVGIGTTGPTSPLTIKSNSVSASDSALTIQGNSNTNAIVKIAEKSTDGARLHMYDGGVEKIAFYTDGTDNHISAGNVGIGTTGPTTKLHIDDNATAGTGLLVTGGGQGGPLATFTRDVGASATIAINASSAMPQIRLVASSNTFALGVNGSTFEIADNTSLGTNARLSISNTGNVGIGDTTPSYKLDVNGAFRVVDDATFNSDIVLPNYQSGTVSTAMKALKKGFTVTMPESSDMQGNPYFMSDLAYFNKKGGTVTATGLTGSYTWDALFRADAEFVSIASSEYSGSTFTLELSDVDDVNALSYGAYCGITFGASAWKPSSVVVEFSTDNGSTYTTALNSSASNYFYYTKLSNLGTTIKNIKFTIGLPSGSSIRIANIFATDYNGQGMKNYFVPSDGGTYFGDVTWLDSQKAKFGSGSDLLIHHNGTDSYLENATGHIYIRNLADDKSIIFQNDNGSGGYENYFELQGISGGADAFTVFPDTSTLVFGNGHDFRLRHNATDSYIENYTGDLKIAQYADDKAIRFYSDNGSGGLVEYLRLDGSSTSIQAYKDLLIANDTAKIKLGASQDLEIYHNGSHSYIDEAGTGNLYIRNGTKNSIWCQTDGAVQLYHNNLTKFSTTSDGVDVNGIITATTYRSDVANTDYNLITRSSTSATLYVQAGGSASTQPIASFRYGSTTANQGSEVLSIKKGETIFSNTNVGIGVSSASYALQVGGSIVGSSKSFLIKHPTKEGKQLLHACIEGPEHGVYFRGKSTSSILEMPDYWIGLVHIDTMTVDITAIGPDQDLYVDSISDNGDVTIGSNTEAPLNYFYVVYGERKDIGKLEIEIVDPEYSNEQSG